ncbi:MAG: histidine phosphatase family protein [Myxococcales bacterium]|nr:histidine phosphatase family protein [Myxococcales bacterium]
MSEANPPSLREKPIHLTLIRHGTAHDADRDSDRALTPGGRREVARVGRGLLRTGTRFDVVVSSPLVRAVQTAEIVIARLDHAGQVVVDRCLEPERSPRAVIEFVRALAPARRIALVAHEPILSSLAGLLLGRPLGRGLLKGEALRIRLAQGLDRPGQWRWSIDPVAGKRKHPASS